MSQFIIRDIILNMPITYNRIECTPSFAAMLYSKYIVCLAIYYNLHRLQL